MRKLKHLLVAGITLIVGLTNGLFAQEVALSNSDLSLAERLGYTSDAKLLIVHADDVGFSHSANSATMQAFEAGPVGTGAIMVPVPWFTEIAAFVQQQPQHDFGVHITLTSEWKYFKWGSVLPKSEVASLISDQGYFYGNGDEVAEHATPDDAEREARAQIERAIAFGIDPTHLDVHNSAFWGTPELFQIYLDLGREYKLPLLLSNDGIAKVSDEYRLLLNSDDILLDRVMMMARDVTADRWVDEYKTLLASVGPGVTQLIIHFGYDDSELRAMALDRPNPDAGWRQRDFDFFTSSEFRNLLEIHDIQLITWRQIRDLLRS